MRYPLLVFDWDGTLIDSAPTIVACIQAACRDLGQPVPEDARASHVIGLGLHDALSYAVPGCRRRITVRWWSVTGNISWRATPKFPCFQARRRCLPVFGTVAMSSPSPPE